MNPARCAAGLCRRLLPPIAICGLALALCPVLRADTIHLKNGNSIEGIVRRETATAVELEVGTGTMRLPLKEIERIEKADPAAAAALREEWARKYYLDRKFVPEGLEELARVFRDLAGRRRAAVGARRAMVEGVRREAELVAGVESTKRMLEEASRALKAVLPEKDVRGYNAVVGRVNALNADLSLAGGELERIRRERADGARTISGYVGALTAFGADLGRVTKARGGKPADERKDRFLRRLREELDAYDRECPGAVVATERDGGGNTVVPVRVNGRADGRFIVDTGASVVTMSEDFARRAGIGDGERTTAEAMLADGRKVTASAVLLSSVQTGEARGERIAAVILPGPPAPGLDGLLGMSFLGRFVMHLDGAAGRLTLREFKPEDGM